MIYNFSKGGLLANTNDEEDYDPMSGLANLADVMLVLACGLMLALLSYWNLELPNVQELESSQLQQVEDVEELVGDIKNTKNPYLELGQVYQDPVTKKMYLLKETEEQSENTSQQGGSNE